MVGERYLFRIPSHTPIPKGGCPQIEIFALAPFRVGVSVGRLILDITLRVGVSVGRLILNITFRIGERYVFRIPYHTPIPKGGCPQIEICALEPFRERGLPTD